MAIGRQPTSDSGADKRPPGPDSGSQPPDAGAFEG
jgi:hypothetical protein